MVQQAYSLLVCSQVVAYQGFWHLAEELLQLKQLLVFFNQAPTQLSHRFLHKNSGTFNKGFKSFINILPRKRRSLQIQQFININKILNSLFLDIPVFQITLITQEHDCDIRLSIISEFGEPLGQIIKSPGFGKIINNDGTLRTPIISISNGPKSFLPSRIPDLILNNFIINVIGFSRKFHTNCWFRINTECAIDKT